MSRLWILVVVAALACGGGSQDRESGSGLTVAVAAAAEHARDTTIDPRRRTLITQAVSEVSPTVVTVQTQIVEHAPVDPFAAFFGRQSGDRTLPGLGSGFILRADGVIVTNAHVINEASSISVALRDGTTYPAKLLGKDDINDLAVLKINASNLPVAKLGDSDNLLIGEWAIAIGNPYGFVLGNSEPSVTTGVISGTGRNLAAQAQGGATYVDMIQTDAAINPGNSGGPLVDAVGEVIGVNSSIYTPSGGSVGIGFAIPINRVKRVAEDLLEHGTIRRPWLGIKEVLPTGDNARQVLSAGVIIHSVVPGSPADKAGLRAGDQLLKAGERTLRNPFDWEAEMLELRVGQPVQLQVRRNGRVFTATVTVADLPEVSAPKVQVLKELELVTLTPTIRAERGIRSAHGAVIYNVSQSVADELGIQKGDVIVQINRVPVTNAQDVQKALEAFSGRGYIRMYFERGGAIYSTDFSIR
ncbi:MAG TPA: trypsin-like peptidase domain-containing protein [Gemmatimonadaceae bacterium]|nr:trypsin-like peptidase domain-containing protein [Gemmatimonadaceae bacterium]